MCVCLNSFELAIAKGDGRYSKLIKDMTRVELLVLDDLGLSNLNDQPRDLLEIFEERYEQRSTIVTSQFPIEHWHELIGDPTLADAILDRLVHNAYKLNLKGESLRKQRKTSQFQFRFESERGVVFHRFKQSY